MNELGVGECLRLADQQVREITLDLGDLDGPALLAAWPAFHRASLSAIEAVVTVGATGVAPAVLVAGRRLRWPDVRAAPDARLVAAADATDRAAGLIQRYATPAALDRHQVGDYLVATLAVAAHVTNRGIHEHLQHGTGLCATPAVLRRAGKQLQRLEDLATITLQGGGLHRAAVIETPETERVQRVLRDWTGQTEQAIGSKSSVQDLRLIAYAHTDLALHAHRITLAVAQVAPDRARPVTVALESNHRAWADAARAWPTHIHDQADVRPARDLMTAANNLRQTLASISHAGRQWAEPADVLAHTDVDALLVELADVYRHQEDIARTYRPAAGRVLVDPGLRVPGRLAHQYTGAPSNAEYVALPPGYRQQVDALTESLVGAASAARIAFDTATTDLAAAAAARSRLPLSMAVDDIDAAIRKRVQDARTPPAQEPPLWEDPHTHHQPDRPGHER